MSKIDRRWLVAALSGAAAACNRKSENKSKPTGVAPAKPKPRPSPYSQAFWDIWGDGQAELCGYDLRMPQGRQQRNGTAVTICVTETFANTLRVKSEPGRRGPADEFPVMKLNLIRDYSTGISDYNDMLSTFVALEAVNHLPVGAATKISFSSQDWCGHVYSQVTFGGNKASAVRHSYFDGEADGETLVPWPDGAFTEDALLLWARRIAFPILRPGGRYNGHALLSLERQRAEHLPLQTHSTALTMSPEPVPIKVAAGEFKVYHCEAKGAGVMRTYEVEADPPHRVIRWQTSRGERAEMLGSIRLKYWEMNQTGGEDGLEAIGLRPRPPRTT